MAENVKEKLKQIEDKLNVMAEIDNKKKQGFLERLFKVDKNKVTKGLVPILYLRNSGAAELMYVKPRDGFFDFNGKIYSEEPDKYWVFGKKRCPMVIIPEWTLKPLDRKEMFEDDKGNQNLQESVTYATKAIEHAEIVKMEGGKPKKPINMKSVVVIGILLVVGYAFMKGQGAI